MEEHEDYTPEEHLNMFEGGGKNKNKPREGAASERNIGNQSGRFSGKG